MAKRTFTVTNRSRGERVLHDAAGKAITFVAGQVRHGIQLAEEHARALHARGGAWHIGGSLGGAGKRVQVGEQTGGDGGGSETTTTQQEARALLDRYNDGDGDLSFKDFRDAAKEFLGGNLPRGKEKVVEALTEFTEAA